MAQKPARQMKLGAVLQGAGIEFSKWLDPELPGDASVNIDWLIENARAAEAAKFDLVFIIDAPFTAPELAPHFLNRLEPLTLLSALAVATSKIGLVGTLTTSYWEPYNVARLFGSLDNISKGRAGWNVVTTALGGAAGNYGDEKLMEHGDRYERAREFVEVVQGLWDSYEDDAFPRDKARGIFIDKAKQHRLDHKGKYFSVAGPLALSRSRQGQPVIFQAGASPEGLDFSARVAEATFADMMSFEKNQAHYAALKTRASALGRNPDLLAVMPVLNTVIGDTDEEAKAIDDAQRRTFDVRKLLVQLGKSFDYYDFSKCDLDAPFSELPNLSMGGFKSHAELVVRTAREEKLTVREVAYRFGMSLQFVGSPETIANELERWFLGGAADGFNLTVNRPKEFKLFRERVVPILQARGLFRTDYEHDTLRGHLGLTVPENRYTRLRRAPSQPTAAAE